jgi:hypothetical protein
MPESLYIESFSITIMQTRRRLLEQVSNPSSSVATCISKQLPMQPVTAGVYRCSELVERLFYLMEDEGVPLILLPLAPSRGNHHECYHNVPPIWVLFELDIKDSHPSRSCSPDIPEHI